jgi:sulfonate transport system substrate-binding protein
MIVRHLLRPLLSLALLGAVAGPLAGCGSGSENASAAAAGHLTLRLGDQGTGLQQLLDQSGALKGAPYKVKVVQFAYGLPLVQSLAADRIDLGSVGNTPPIFGAAASTRFRAVAALKTTDTNGDSIVVPKGSPITDIRQLEGKRLAVAQGSSAHGFTLNVLKAAGLTVDRVKLANMDPAAAQAAFSAGKVDAWAIWQPQVSLAEAKGARSIASGPPYETTNSFEVASLATLRDPAKRKALADLLLRLGRAYAWSGAHPAEQARIYEQVQGLSPAVAKLTVAAGAFELAAIDAAIVKAEQSIADNLLEAKQVDAHVDVRQILDDSILKEARR